MYLCVMLRYQPGNCIYHICIYIAIEIVMCIKQKIIFNICTWEGETNSKLYTLAFLTESDEVQWSGKQIAEYINSTGAFNCL